MHTHSWQTNLPFRVGASRKYRGVPVAERTGPLAPLRGKRLLVVADVQNLDLSARDLGYRLSWARLGRSLTGAAKSASLHAVFACRTGDNRRAVYFANRGWSAVRQRYAGRQVGGRLNVRDPLSRHAKVQKNIKVDRLDQYCRETDEWIQVMVEDKRTPVLDQVAFRIDVPLHFGR